MNALILAAGLGTRLMPLTAHKPKALVEVAGRPLLHIAIENLIKHGFTRIVVNVHHFAPLIISYLRSNRWDAEILISDETQLLMDTGGAIIHARRFLDVGEPFLVHNVDILSNINLSELYSAHLQSCSMVTLAVSGRQSSRRLIFDADMILCGWRNVATGEQILPRPSVREHVEYAFSGIHVISPELYNKVFRHGSFSIISEYLNLCVDNKILGVDCSANTIVDVGTPQRVDEANSLFSQGFF